MAIFMGYKIRSYKKTKIDYLKYGGTMKKKLKKE